ncbi:MAG: DUF4465 domain-containing protein [bacterium]
MPALCLIAAFTQNSMATDIDFSNLSLSAGSYWNGSTGTGGFSSGGAFFNNSYYYDTTYQYESWSGWSYSNITNTSITDYTNQYSAITGAGVNGPGSIYAIAYGEGPNDSYINLPSATIANSMRLTNTTYTYNSMLSGDQFAKKFGGATGNDPDYFMVKITGYSSPGATGTATGSVNFYLADYRFANNSQDYLINNWTTVSLSALSPATRSLGFQLFSSDVGSYGMNTPAYFALGSVQVTNVPEPASIVLATASAMALIVARRFRSKSFQRQSSRSGKPASVFNSRWLSNTTSFGGT